MKRNLLLPFLLAPHLFMAQFTVDPTFASEGVFALPDTDPVMVHKIARSPDGSFFLKLNHYDPDQWPSGTYVLHLLSDGTPDPEFGLNGRVPFSGKYVEDIAVQDDGKLIAVGTIAASNRGFILRLDVTGTPDGSFGINGFFQNSAVDGVNQVTITPNGSIMATGLGFSDPAAGQGGIQVIRLLPNGTLDPTYIPNLGLVPCVPDRFWLQKDGSILVQNHFGTWPQEEFRLIRIEQDGSVDQSFNNGLGYYRPFEGTSHPFLDVTLDAESRIVGLVTNSFFGHRSIHRLLSSGVPDSSFHAIGYVQEPILDGGGTVAQWIDTDPDGRILIAQLQPVGAEGHALMISRILTSGMPDPSVGPDGRQYLTDLPSMNFGHTSILADGNDRIKVLYPRQDFEHPYDTWALLGLSISSTSIDQLQGEGHILVYPNPATERLSLALGGMRVTQLSIHDAAGRMLHNEVGGWHGDVHVDISDLDPGYYRVTLIDDEERRYSEGIVKE